MTNHDCGCRCHVGGTFISCDRGPEIPGGRDCNADLQLHPVEDGGGGAAATPGQPSGARVEPVEPRELWQAVDAITQPRRTRLERDGRGSEWVDLPSLWQQLLDAIESGAGRKTGGRGQQSKPPLDAAALSLMLEVVQVVRDQIRAWRKAARAGGTSMPAKATLDDVKDLRAVVSWAVRSGNASTMATWLDRLTRWRSRIVATISNDPDRTWRMAGACRVCSATHVPTEVDGEVVHVPALVVYSTDGVIDQVVCDLCGSTLTAPELTDLVNEQAGRAVDVNPLQRLQSTVQAWSGYSPNEALLQRADRESKCMTCGQRVNVTVVGLAVAHTRPVCIRPPDPAVEKDRGQWTRVACEGTMTA